MKMKIERGREGEGGREGGREGERETDRQMKFCNSTFIRL